MKYYLNVPLRLILFIFLFTSISCRKSITIDNLEEEVVNVNFKFIGFTSQIYPLPSTVNVSNKKAALFTNSNQEAFESYLYYWSFNANNLLADIVYNQQLPPSISYANGDIPTVFVNSTYVFDNFQAGRALTFAGAKDILIKMPIKNAIEVNSLGFDVGSPSTGPKDFEIYYSIDKGLAYSLLSLVNQFENTNTTNQKHTYLYNLTPEKIQAEELWIKIRPKAGDRGTSSSFNENNGILRMDNLYLRGVAPVTSAPNYPDKLHYFLFDKERANTIISGVGTLDDDKMLNLSIPIGKYDVCFVTNDSNTELLFSKNLTVENFYIGNIFSNAKANVFAYKGELVVKKEKSDDIILERLFSEIKVEFTDERGLETITKIAVQQQHAPYFYAPFNAALSTSILDQSTIEIIEDFQIDKQIIFNQFLGKLEQLKPVSYKLSIYGKDGILRELNLSSTLKNNMQLVFRGDILENTAHNNAFSIIKNEKWDGQAFIYF